MYPLISKRESAFAVPVTVVESSLAPMIAATRELRSIHRRYTVNPKGMRHIRIRQRGVTSRVLVQHFLQRTPGVSPFSSLGPPSDRLRVGVDAPLFFFIGHGDDHGLLERERSPTTSRREYPVEPFPIDPFRPRKIAYRRDGEHDPSNAMNRRASPAQSGHALLLRPHFSALRYWA